MSCRSAESTAAGRRPEGSATARTDARRPEWSSSGNVPALSPFNPHVWLVDISAAACVDEEDLSSDEQARAARMTPLTRRAWLRARIALRSILARYLDVPPSLIAFDHSKHGKPVVRGRPGGPHFNISHSGDFAVVGVAAEHPIGVDVERVQPLADMPDLMREFFSETERQQISDVPPPERTPAFYRCWTRKEALVKADGIGLSAPHRFVVTSDDIERPHVIAVPDSHGPATRWSLLSLPVPTGYAGAIASSGRLDAVELLRFPQHRMPRSPEHSRAATLT